MCKFSLRVKKILRIAFLLLLFMIMLSLSVFAAEIDFDTDFYNSLSAETQEVLNELGIAEMDYQAILDISPRKMIDLAIGVLKGKLIEPLQTSVNILLILILTAIVGAFTKEHSANKNLTETISCFLIVSMIVIPLSQSMTAAIASTQISSKFMLSYIPAFTSVVAMSGKPLTSAAYSGLTLAFGEFASQICVAILPGLIRLMMCLVCLSSFENSFQFDRINQLIRKSITIVLSLSATVFVGLITVKGILSSSADSVAIRSAKLVAGNSIPIVGNAIGDAYSSILTSFSLIKNTVGIFGILSLIITFLPSILELLIWYFILEICATISGTLQMYLTEKAISGICSIVVLMNIIIIFFAAVFILSTGIILSLRN